MVNYPCYKLNIINLIMSYKAKLKTAFIGDTSTGKTSIALRLVRNEFVNTDSTIGASFFVLDADEIRYEIWDTAGGERFLALTPMYFRSSSILIMVYDLNELSTVDRLQKYFDMIEKTMRCIPKIIVVGNKLDLITDKELNSVKETIPNKIRKMTKEPLEKFVYMSAKTGEGFDDFKKILLNIGETIERKLNKDSGTIFLHSDSLKSTDKTCKC